MNKLLKCLLIILLFVVSFSYMPTFYAAESTNTAKTTEELESYTPATNNEGNLSCADLFGSTSKTQSLLSILNDIYTVSKIAAVTIVIALSMLDFTQAITASDQDALNKSLKKFTTRLILLVCFFLVPTLLEIIFDVAFGGNMGCFK